MSKSRGGRVGYRYDTVAEREMDSGWDDLTKVEKQMIVDMATPVDLTEWLAKVPAGQTSRKVRLNP